MSKIIGRSKKAKILILVYMLLAKKTKPPRIVKAVYYLSAFMKRTNLIGTINFLKNPNLQYLVKPDRKTYANCKRSTFSSLNKNYKTP